MPKLNTEVLQMYSIRTQGLLHSHPTTAVILKHSFSTMIYNNMNATQCWEGRLGPVCSSILLGLPYQHSLLQL